MAKNALCIGINNYPGTHMDLQGCVNDANDWAAALAERGFKVAKLLDDQATKAAMVKAMNDLIGKAGKGDSLVITFSGHGTYQPDTDGDEADGLDEALCPYDLQTKGEALIDDEIRQIFGARKAGVRIVLISDSCHSGTVTRAAAAEKARRYPPPLHADGQLAAGKTAAEGSRRQAGNDDGRARRHFAAAERLFEQARRPAALRLQGRPQQLQLRRPHRRPLQRCLYLLRAEGAERLEGRRHLCRMA